MRSQLNPHAVVQSGCPTAARHGVQVASWCLAAGTPVCPGVLRRSGRSPTLHERPNLGAASSIPRQPRRSWPHGRLGRQLCGSPPRRSAAGAPVRPMRAATQRYLMKSGAPCRDLHTQGQSVWPDCCVSRCPSPRRCPAAGTPVWPGRAATQRRPPRAAHCQLQVVQGAPGRQALERIPGRQAHEQRVGRKACEPERHPLEVFRSSPALFLSRRFRRYSTSTPAPSSLWCSRRGPTATRHSENGLRTSSCGHAGRAAAQRHPARLQGSGLACKLAWLRARLAAAAIPEASARDCNKP